MIIEIILGAIFGILLAGAGIVWVDWRRTERRIRREVAKMTLQEKQDYKNKSMSKVIDALNRPELYAAFFKPTWCQKLRRWWRIFTLRGSR